MMTDKLLVEEHDGVTTLSLNRPDKLNAIDNDLAQGTRFKLPEAGLGKALMLLGEVFDAAQAWGLVWLVVADEEIHAAARRRRRPPCGTRARSGWPVQARTQHCQSGGLRARRRSRDEAQREFLSLVGGDRNVAG